MRCCWIRTRAISSSCRAGSRRRAGSSMRASRDTAERSSWIPETCVRDTRSRRRSNEPAALMPTRRPVSSSTRFSRRGPAISPSCWSAPGLPRSAASVLDDTVQTLNQFVAVWPAPAVEQYRALQAAAASRNFQDAARDVAFLRNVLVRTTVFRESLTAVRTPTELIAEPFERFLALPSPSSNPSPADEWPTFAAEGIEPRRPPQRRADVDWNRDFKMDYAVCDKTGVHVFVQVSEQAGGTFRDATPKTDPLTADCFGVWAADVEMDGDVDLIAGVRGAAPVVLRNNGDGSWKQLRPFSGVVGLRAFAWGDVDGDGDPDAMLVGENGDLRVFENRQAGEFRELEKSPGPIVAVAVGDLNADGRLDIVTLAPGG